MNAEEFQRNVLGIINTALKTTPAATRMDVNAFLFELASKWNAVALPGKLQLQPLYDLMCHKGVPSKEAAMVCLLVLRREDRLGVEVVLPTVVGALTEAQRADLLATLPQMGAPAVAVSGFGRPVSSSSMARATPVKVAAPSSSGGHKIVNAGRTRGPVSAGTLVVCGVLLAVGIGVRVFMLESGLSAFKGSLPPELSTFQVFVLEKNMFFYDAAKDFELSKAELDTLGKKMFQTATTAGMERAYMCLGEDKERCSRIKAVAHKRGVVYLLKPPAGAKVRSLNAGGAQQ